MFDKIRRGLSSMAIGAVAGAGVAFHEVTDPIYMEAKTSITRTGNFVFSEGYSFDAIRDDRGSVNITGIFYAMIAVLVVTLFGLILFPIFVSSTITANATTGIGSFAGVAAMLGLIPLLVTVGIIGVVIGGAVLLFTLVKSRQTT